MIKMDVRDPVVFNGTEWISFRFHGQSFMLHQVRSFIHLFASLSVFSVPPSPFLHRLRSLTIFPILLPTPLQIRKMISLALLTVRTSTPPTLIPEAFGPSRIHIPKAPPLGLLLEQPLFGSYNTNVSKGSFTAAQEKIDFEQYRKEMDAFKLREIYERLREEEEATDT
jgi:tRNA pseudouridine38-40 synthase